MAAYQCLNCRKIERGLDDCCHKPDLFCVNDMPAEILLLRANATLGRGLGLLEAAEVVRNACAFTDWQQDGQSVAEQLTQRAQALAQALDPATPTGETK